jgi:hypothetical protein
MKKGKKKEEGGAIEERKKRKSKFPRVDTLKVFKETEVVFSHKYIGTLTLTQTSASTLSLSLAFGFFLFPTFSSLERDREREREGRILAPDFPLGTSLSLSLPKCRVAKHQQTVKLLAPPFLLSKP